VENTQSLKNFVGNMSASKERPHDNFAQAHSLLESDSNDIMLFAQICEKQMMLANISSDDYLRYSQEDMALLTHLFDMARRDPELRDFFLTRYYTIKSELQMTRAKDGLEIKAQHNVASQFKPGGQISGFGGPEVAPEEQNLFAKVWDKFAKRNPQQQQQGPQMR